MPLCEDGLADFQYEGNKMSLLLRSFGLDTNKVLKRVYIEVKSSAGEEKFFFHLSDPQFRNVRLFFHDLFLILRHKNFLGRTNCI